MPIKSKHSINGIHAQRLKSIRRFVDFDFDLRHPLTKYQKEKIRTYYKEIKKLTSRPHHVYRSKNRANLAKVQHFAQHEKRLPGLKVAFVPSDGVSRLKIRIDKRGRVATKTDFVITAGLDLDPVQLAIDAVRHVNQVIKSDPTAKAFTVRAGAFEIAEAQSRESIAEFVARKVAKYNKTDDDGKPSNHHYSNWLNGLNAHHFQNQFDLQTYMEEKSQAIAKGKRERAAAKRAAAYAKRKLKK